MEERSCSLKNVMICNFLKYKACTIRCGKAAPNRVYCPISKNINDRIKEEVRTDINRTLSFILASYIWN